MNQNVEYIILLDNEVCPICESKNMVLGKIMGLRLIDWSGNYIKITSYYNYCSKCKYHKFI